MPRSCTICRRPDVGSINALLLDGRSARSVALGLGLSEDALQRHAGKHVGRVVPTGNGVPAMVPLGNTSPDDPLTELVEALRPKALTGDPQVAHQYRLALALRDVNRNAAPPTRALATEPEWIALRTRLLRALEPFAEARQAVITAIGGMA